MPEFVLQNAEAIASESEFVQGFIEALFFTETANGDYSEEWFSAETQERLQEGQTDGTIPADIGADSLEPESLATIRKFCEAFQTANAELLALAYARDYDERQAGRDLLFTHCGHGVGYWDRETLATDDSEEYERLTDIMRNAGDNREAWQEACKQREALKAEAIGERLSKAAGRGECSPYYGEDGKVSVSLY